MSDTETPGQWISELFQPTYSFTVDDVRAGRHVEQGPIKSKIKRVAAFDPEAIQQAYEKVRVMNILDEEMKKQTRDRRFGRKTAEAKIEKSESTKSEAVQKDKPVDLTDSCIWNTDELNTLRKVFKSAKGRIKELEVRLRETEVRNSRLEKENFEMRKALETSTVEVKEACKANQRLKIHCDNLKGQLESTSAKLDAVTEMWKEISEEKSAMVKEAQQLRITTDRERLNRERMELKVSEAGNEIIREKHLAEAKAKTKYEKMIFDLEQQVKALTDELYKEKQSHSISQKALSSLRNHFASLPLQNIVPPNAVFEDQVRNIDYLSLS